MTLILTEKPSVAADFAKALKASKSGGFWKSNEYVIAHARGHLFGLKDPEDYDPDLKTWSLDTLPIAPAVFEYKPLPDTKPLISTIQALFQQFPISETILATDAGREGELIGRVILNQVKYKGPIKRFWSSAALTEPVIAQGLKEARDISFTDTLFKAGESRQKADWLLGINFTRYFTKHLGDLFSVGRVQTCILALICQREREARAFVKKTYYQLIGQFEKNLVFPGLYFEKDINQFDTKDYLEKIKDSIFQIAFAEVVGLETQYKNESPPLLMNLTALQKIANKQFGFTADKTLSLAQSLYETHKVLSYPRTPSKVLSPSSFDLVTSIIQTFSPKHPRLFANLDQAKLKSTYKRVFDDAKLEDHHALIPLALPTTELSADEKSVFDLVLISFAMAFSPNYEYKETKATLAIDTTKLFASKGIEVLAHGWKALQTADDSDEDKETETPKTLPPLTKGEKILLKQLEVIERWTTPPKAFTDASLLSVMENPMRFLTDKAVIENKFGIGTQATRANIIETLLGRKYITRKGKALVPTDKAYVLIDALAKSPLLSRIIKVDETAQWEQELEQSPQEFMLKMTAYVRQAIASLKTSPPAVPKAVGTGDQGSPNGLGKCPLCKTGNILSGKANYFCSRYKENCGFSVGKTIAGANITESALAALITGKPTRELSFTSKEKKPFKAKLKLKSDGKIEFVFS